MADSTVTYKEGVVTFTLVLDGQQADPTYKILSVLVVREVNKIPYARITLLDGDVATEDFETSNAKDFAPGSEIEVLAGYNSEEDSIYKGIITRHGIKIRKNRPSVLQIECRDKAVSLTVGRKSAYFYESKDSDVMEEILGNYDVETNVESTDTTHKEMIQYNSTDWDFILSRAEANGKLVFVKDGKVTISKPDDSQSADVLLKYGDNLLEFEADVDARDQYTAVSSRSWDSANQEMILAEAEDPSFKDQGNLDVSDLADVVGLKTLEVLHSGQITDEELQALSDAQLLKSRLAKVRGRVKFQGIPDVNPGDYIELAGVGERFNGEALVTAISHEIGNGNWLCNAQFGLSPQWFTRENKINESPATGLLPAVSGLHIGVVTKLEGDPDSEERVMVKIPAINPDEEGIWARVATLDAGDSRGSFFRPEIDDEVVIGYLNDDPRNPVILGMLHSSAKPAPIVAADDNHEKGFITRSEMKVLFNDDLNSIEISTPNGNSIILSEDEGSVVLKDENDNKIEMTSDGITIESSADLNIKASGDVNIEGTNITSAASAQYKAEGSSGAEVSSGATAVLKGSLVQIN